MRKKLHYHLTHNYIRSYLNLFYRNVTGNNVVQVNLLSTLNLLSVNVKVFHCQFSLSLSVRNKVGKINK